MQVTSISQLAAKPIANWGKIYDVTYLEASNTTIPAANMDVRDYLQAYFDQVVADAHNQLNADQIYTIVFPARDYIIKTVPQTGHLKLDLRGLVPHVNGALFNIIGVSTDYSNQDLFNGNLGNQYTFINTHLVSMDIQMNGLGNVDYLKSVNPTPMPKWIWQPLDIGNIIQNQSTSQLLCMFNSITGNQIDPNGVNFMGFEIQGEAFNQWNNLRPHPYMNKTGCLYSMIKAFMWDKLYIDNNHLHDHYGTGLLLTLGQLFTNYGYDCFRQNHEIEISDNQIKNVYGFDPAPYPWIGLYDDGGDGISLVGLKAAKLDKNIVFNDMTLTGMCGRVGIGGESFQDCLINRNMINGYNRDIHIEIDLGNNMITKNRCTGTYCNVLLSSPDGDINPNIITGNYFSNENIPEDNELWPWAGIQFTTPISSAINWSYSYGMVYMTSESGTRYIGTTISHNEFFIDAFSGDYTSILTRRYIHYNGNGDNFDMGLRINCNLFHHNHLNTPAYNLYGLMLEPEVPLNGPKKEIVKEFYGNIIDDAGSSWLNPQVPFSNDINYFHSNQVIGGNFATNAALSPNFPNFTTPSSASFCCTDEETITNVSKIYLENPQATNLPNNTYNNTTFYIKGQFAIDHDMTFNNCTFYFTSNGSMNLQGASILDLNACTLQASCDYWQGIIADDPQQKVILQNDSYIKKAGIGLHASYGAVIEVTDSHFEDNYQYGIYINSTAGPYAGIINHNTFTMQANVASNPFPPIKAGIHLYDVAQLNIGDIGNANTENHFEGLYTGIWVTNHDFNTASNIGIYNCSFKNISNTALTGNYIESQKINNCYNSARGAGVFANYTGLPNVATRLIDVRNTAAANVNLKFENCDKGIVSSALPVKAKNLYLKDCLMGMMNALTDGKGYQIEDNTIHNTFVGIQLLNDVGNSTLKNNTIDIDVTGIANGLYTQIWPIGIDVKYYSNTNPKSLMIQANPITLNGYSGVGINLNNTSANTNAYANHVNLTNTEATIVCMATSNLNGISATNVKSTQIEQNIINGNASLVSQEREDMAGIQINNSAQQALHCNHISHTRFGMMAQGECLTDPDKIKGNMMYDHHLGWVFRHLGTEGTFGDVGTPNKDNANIFAGSYAADNKIYKFCEDQQGFIIFTNSNFIDGNESGSYDLNNPNDLNPCPYGISINQVPVTTYSCPAIAYITPSTTSSTVFSLSEALEIAMDTKTYTEFYEVARWMDVRKLYKQLETDTTFRNSSDTLVTFYDSLQNEIIQELESTENSLSALFSSMESQNYSLYQQRLAEAEQNNSNVVSATVQEANEHDINAIYLKLQRYGLDSITQNDSVVISALASQCPYIGGTAVYKARSLNAMYYPAILYDDIKICNNIGVYKTGGGNDENDRRKTVYENENKFLKNIGKKNIERKDDLFKLYPNPASTQLTITYSLISTEKGKLVIYDILGREQIQIDLQNNVNKVSINIQSLPQGIYMFKFFVNNDQTETGKLLIE